MIKSRSLFFNIFGDSGAAYIYALGVCVIAGKQIVNWHLGIAVYGFYLFLVSLTVTSVTYFILTYSFAEMVSIIPFSGGCYGYSRCTLGPAIGYYIGVAEAAKYVLFSILNAFSFAYILKTVFEFGDDYMPVVWLAYFGFANLIVALSTKYLWFLWGILAIGTLLTQFIFIFGAIKIGDVGNLGTKFNDFNKDGEDFIQTLSLSLYLISGVDAVRTCANDRSNHVVPLAMLYVMIAMILISYAEVVAMRSYVLNPLKLVLYMYGYNVGLEQVFPLVETKYLCLFSIAGVWGSGYGFLYGGARQVRSMAGSGLLPRFLLMSQSKEQVQDESVVASQGKNDLSEKGGALDKQERDIKPTMALAASSLLAYVLLVVGFYEIDDFSRKLSRMCSLLATIQTCGLMLAYCVFCTRFSNLERHVRSPFHIPGAFIVIGYFIVTFVWIFYDEDDSQNLGYTLIIFFAVSALYYHLVAKKRQFFSKEEQEKFMKAYVVNANKRKKASSKKGAPTIIERLVSVVPGLSSLVAPFVGGHSSVGGKSASHSQPEGGVSVASGSVPASPGKVFVKSSPAKVAPAIETRPTESTD